MTVTLIIPPSGFLLDELVFPTLGILKVAAVLERAGVTVRVLDLSGVRDVPAAVSAHLCDARSDVYGLTATMPQMPAAADIARQIQQEDSKARLILGGPHVTLMHASARQEYARHTIGRAGRAMADLHQLFDVLVCGDGEAAIFEALHPEPPDLVDADNTASHLFLTPSALDETPFPARHLIDLDSYHYAIDGVRAQSAIIQLGCPMQCAFCGGRRSPFLRRIRTRSTANAIAEMRHLYEVYGTSGFMFFDDELNINRQFLEFLEAIEDLQLELGAEFRLRGFLKAELITEDMPAAMYRAGFREVLVGFESGDDRILQNIRKMATRDDNTKAVEILQRAGLRVKAAMSIGHPGEQEQTIEATRSWLKAVRPDEFDLTIITVYPGTPYYDDAREEQPGIWTYRDPKNGDALHAYPVDQFAQENFYKGIPGSYQSFVYTDHLSAQDLCTLRDDVEADVRSALKIPYPTSAVARAYEHSMGQ